jgi:hypothetical protein
MERKSDEAAQVRKCGSKIVLKRQHLLQIEMQRRGSLAKQLRREKWGSKIVLKRQHLLQIGRHWRGGEAKQLRRENVVARL